MSKGYFAGFFWGAVMAGIFASGASVLTGPVLAPKPGVTDSIGDISNFSIGAGVDAPPGLDPRRDTVSRGAPPRLPELPPAHEQVDGLAEDAETPAALPSIGAVSPSDPSANEAIARNMDEMVGVAEPIGPEAEAPSRENLPALPEMSPPDSPHQSLPARDSDVINRPVPGAPGNRAQLPTPLAETGNGRVLAPNIGPLFPDETP